MTVHEFVLVSRPVSHFRMKVSIRICFWESGDGVSDGELAVSASVSVARSDCFSVASGSVGPSACVSDLTATLDSESEVHSVSSQTSPLLSPEALPQTATWLGQTRHLVQMQIRHGSGVRGSVRRFRLWRTTWKEV